MTRVEKLAEIKANAIAIINKPFNEKSYQILKQEQRLRECLERMSSEEEYIGFCNMVNQRPTWHPAPSEMGIGDD